MNEALGQRIDSYAIVLEFGKARQQFRHQEHRLKIGACIVIGLLIDDFKDSLLQRCSSNELVRRAILSGW